MMVMEIFITRTLKAYEGGSHKYNKMSTAVVPSFKIYSSILVVFRLMKVRL